jgi:hypothetical protein
MDPRLVGGLLDHNHNMQGSQAGLGTRNNGGSAVDPPRIRTQSLSEDREPLTPLRFPWRALTWLENHRLLSALALYGAYLMTGAYTRQSVDVAAAEEPAWALATHGTLDLTGIASYELPWYHSYEGAIYSDRFPGSILYLVPAYWLADLLGLDRVTFIPGVVVAAASAAGTVILMRSVFATILPLREARGATIFLALGTGTWSLSANAPWSHTIDQLIIAGTLFLLSRGSWSLAALSSGALIFVRPPLAVVPATIGIALSFWRRSPRLLLKYAVLATPGLVMLLAYNGLLFDRWAISNGFELGGEIRLRLEDLPANLLGALFSPSRGMLIYYPIMIIVPVTVRSAWRIARDWEKAAFLAGLLSLMLQMSLNRYSGGDAFFGPRLLIEPLTLCAPLIARAVALFAETQKVRAVSMCLVAGIAIHGIGAIAS